ncbi:MAG: LuxR family transcriptional regulator [Microbacterium sp.]|nr:MAG: LuxR family transcriptional regulator [Microbacterium sp.]
MSRIVLIDDHESVRLGLEAACERAGAKDVVFSGSTVSSYLEWRAASGEPPADVVVLDLTLGDGATVTENVSRIVADGSAVLIHSVADRPTAVREALTAGAAGIISKSSRADDVVEAIRTIARGEPLENLEWAHAVDGDRAFADAQLSARERDVLRLYAAGLPLKAVAERLGVAYSTAKENITRVRVKYVEVGRPAPTKIDLLHRAMEDGLVGAERSERSERAGRAERTRSGDHTDRAEPSGRPDDAR